MPTILEDLTDTWKDDPKLLEKFNIDMVKIFWSDLILITDRPYKDNRFLKKLDDYNYIIRKFSELLVGFTGEIPEGLDEDLNIFLDEIKDRKLKTVLVINYKYDEVKEYDYKFMWFLNNYNGYAKRLILFDCYYAPFKYNKDLQVFHEIYQTSFLSNIKLGFYLNYMRLNHYGGNKVFIKNAKLITEKVLLF